MPESTKHIEIVSDALMINTSILQHPEKMSSLGRALLEIENRIDASGQPPRSIEEIHRELALVNSED